MNLTKTILAGALLATSALAAPAPAPGIAIDNSIEARAEEATQNTQDTQVIQGTQIAPDSCLPRSLCTYRPSLLRCDTSKVCHALDALRRGIEC